MVVHGVEEIQDDKQQSTRLSYNPMPEVPEVLVWEKLLKRKKFTNFLCVYILFIPADLSLSDTTSLPCNIPSGIFTGLRKTGIYYTHG